MRVLDIWHGGVVSAYRTMDRIMNDSDDCEVVLFVPEGWNEGAQWRQAEPEPADSSLRVVVGKAALKFHGSTFFYISGLRRVLKEFRPDVILLHEEPWSFCAAQAMVYRRLYCPRAQLIFKSWQNIYKRFPPPFSIIERTMFKAADCAIAGNIEVQEVLKKKGFRKPLTIVPLGIDEDTFKPMEASDTRRRLGASEEETLIGFVGRVERQKGVHTLLESLTLLPPSVRLAIVGNGSFRPEARQLADTLGIAGQVVWVDAVEPSEVPKYMNAFDVLALPSITMPNWKEQFGRVLAEAMACGTIAIGSDSGEIPNVIGDSRLVFHQGDAGALAETVQRLLDDPALAHELRSKQRERALSAYSYRALAQKTLDFCMEAGDRIGE